MEGKKCEKERPKKVYRKRIFKGFYNDESVGKSEKERHRAVSSEKNLYKVLEVEVRPEDYSV